MAEPFVDADGAWVRSGERYFTVPRANLDKALAKLPLSRPATADEVTRYKRIREESGFGATVESLAKTAGVAAISGAADLTARAQVAAADVIAEHPIAAPVVGALAAPILLPSIAGAATLGAITTPQEREDFLEATSPTGVRANIAAAAEAAQLGQGGDILRAAAGGIVDPLLPGSPVAPSAPGVDVGRAIGGEYDASLEQQRAEEEAHPIATNIAKGIGQAAGGLAAGGGALGTVAGVGRATPLLRAIAGGAVATGTEGAVQGALTPYDQSALENTQVNRDSVISSGLWGGLFGAALGGGGVAGGRAAGSIIRSLGPKVTGEAADTVLRGTVPDAPTGAGKAIAGVEGRVAQAEREVLAAAEAAGVNPAAREAAATAAAEAQAAKIAAEAGDITPENWRAAPGLSDLGKWQHRDKIIAGAAQSVTEDLDNMVSASRNVSREVRSVPLKLEHVRKNLAASEIDQTAAIEYATRNVRAVRGALDAIELEDGVARQLRESDPNAKAYQPWKSGKIRSSVRGIRQAIDLADSKASNATGAAEAYIAQDALRRELLTQRSALAAALDRTADAAQRIEGERLLGAVDSEYRRLAEGLFDESVWGQQGATQRAVNTSLVETIKANKIGAKNFLSLTDEDEFGRAILSADPAKVRRYIESVGEPSLRDAQFKRILDAEERTINALKNGYELSPEKLAKAESALASIRRLRETLSTAEEVSATANTIAEKLSAANIGTGGGILGYLLGSPARAWAGARVGGTARAGLVGALSPSGIKGALEGAAKIRTLAQGQQSRVAEFILGSAEKLIGKGGGGPGLATVKSVRKTPTPGTMRRAAQASDAFTKAALSSAPFVRVFLPRDGETRAERQARHAKRRELLAELVTNPAKLSAAMSAAVEPELSGSPTLSHAITMDMIAQLKRLHDKMPGATEFGLIPATSKPNLSDQELRQADAYVTATVNPTQIFEDFQKGLVDYDAIDFAREQHPGLFEYARGVAMEMFLNLDGALPIQTATQLDLLLDFNGALDPFTSGAFMARHAERSVAQAQGAGSANPAPPGARAARPPRLAKQAATFTTQVSQQQ